MTHCIFIDCPHPAQEGSTKCIAHRNRTQCTVRCPIATTKRMPEGDAKKNCAIEKCQYNRRFGSLCSKHADATQKKYCDVKGCTNQFHARGKCVRHGGGCFCKSTGCHRHARIGGFCTRHAELSANIPLGAPLAKPDMLDWAILQDLLEDARNTDNSVEHVDKHAKHSKKIAV